MRNRTAFTAAGKQCATACAARYAGYGLPVALRRDTKVICHVSRQFFLMCHVRP